MGIYERHSIHCDWCGAEPEEGPTFDSYTEAYAEVIRLARYESWFIKRVGKEAFKLLCPECVAEGR